MKRNLIPSSALGKCSSCGASVIFAYTDTGGTRMPVDIDEVVGGTVALVVIKEAEHLQPVDGPRLRARVVSATLAFGRTNLHTSHFATCPKADKHRRPRLRRGGELLPRGAPYRPKGR